MTDTQEYLGVPRRTLTRPLLLIYLVVEGVQETPGVTEAVPSKLSAVNAGKSSVRSR